MTVASFVAYALLLLQFSPGSNSQKFFIDTSRDNHQELSIDKSKSNPQKFFLRTKGSPQEFFIRTEENLEGSLIDKSKTNPQKFFLGTKAKSDELVIQKPKTNPQEYFIKTKENVEGFVVEKSKTNPQEFFLRIKANPEHHANPNQVSIDKSSANPQGLNPVYNVYFNFNDLSLGKKLQIYFFSSNHSAPSHLSREEADSIPFTSSALPYLLELFSVPNNSPEAETMKDTIEQCEAKPMKDEFKFCATSLEFMLEKARAFLGTANPNVFTTNILSPNHVLFQNYTVVKKPLEISSKKMVVCHTLAYPYTVHYCHAHKGHSSKLFKIALAGENGERVDAMAVCHMDTSKWNPNHVSFKVIGGEPGITHVCHVLPTDNIAWTASP